MPLPHACQQVLDVNLAIAMAAVCNCAGVVVMTMVNSTVAMTITNMVNFGEDTSIALVAVCRAFFHCGMVILCCFHWMSYQ